jgi:hypothetical protein
LGLRESRPPLLLLLLLLRLPRPPRARARLRRDGEREEEEDEDEDEDEDDEDDCLRRSARRPRRRARRLASYELSYESDDDDDDDERERERERARCARGGWRISRSCGGGIDLCRSCQRRSSPTCRPWRSSGRCAPKSAISLERRRAKMHKRLNLRGASFRNAPHSGRKACSGKCSLSPS